MDDHGCVPVKLYLQKTGGGPSGYNLPIPYLEQSLCIFFPAPWKKQVSRPVEYSAFWVCLIVCSEHHLICSAVLRFLVIEELELEVLSDPG